jgi:hypothetical protein
VFIHTCHAAPLQCSDHAALRATFQGHGTARQGNGTATWHMWINVGRLSTGCWWPAQVRILPATTRTFAKFVNQNVVAFWDVFNCPDDDGDSRLYEIWTNLKVKASLSSVVMLRLHCVFFFWLSAGNNAVKFPNFEISKRKIYEKCLLSFIRPNSAWNSPSSTLAHNTLWIQ